MRNFLFILLFISLPAIGQTVYTNRVNHVAHNTRPAFEIVGDYYYVANNLNISPYSQMQYVKLDTLGNVLNTLNILWDPNYVFPSNCPKCLDYHHGVLYHAYSNGKTRDSAAIILSKVRLDLSDTVLTQYYPTINGHGLDIKDLEFDSDSTFIIAAIDAFYTGDSAPQAVFKFNTLVARLDTNFNILWETIIPDTDPNRNFGVFPEDIVIDAYGSILVTGTPAWVAQVSEAFAARIRISDGHLYWRKSYTGNLGIRGMNAFDHGDGTYRYVQDWITDVNNAYHLYEIGILDTAGIIISSKQYGSTNQTHTANDLIRLKDGNYYCAGVTHQFKGLGFKFTPNLDSLWMKQFSYGPVSNTCYLEVFKEDSSGMIAHTGWVTSNRVDNWIFRIDTKGCTVSNCDIGIPENPVLDERWEVFPNPSTGPFTIYHPEMETLGPLVVQIHNMEGRLVYDGDHVEGEPIQLQLDVAGEYQVIIAKQNREVIGLQKVLILGR